MKKIIINKNTANGFLGTIKKLVKNNQSVVFPRTGLYEAGTKFGNIRKISSASPHRLTTKNVKVNLVCDGIEIVNPLNEGFGYSYLVIPFGVITFAYGSFFWIDEYGIHRQMQFSKAPGWALILSGGRAEPISNF